MPIVLLLVGGLLTLSTCPFSRRRHGEPPEFDVEKAKADIRAIDWAVREYAAQNQGQLPSSLELLLLPDANGDSLLQCEALPPDPWKHPYRYELCATPPGFRVFSLGADGASGGEGEDEDIDNITLGQGRL